MTMPATSTTSPAAAPRVWRLVVGEDELEQLHEHDDLLPRLGAAIRPDFAGRWIVYNDAQRLGELVLLWDCVDYTHHTGRLAYYEIEYDPTAR